VGVRMQRCGSQSRGCRASQILRCRILFLGLFFLGLPLSNPILRLARTALCRRRTRREQILVRWAHWFAAAAAGGRVPRPAGRSVDLDNRNFDIECVPEQVRTGPGQQTRFISDAMAEQAAPRTQLPPDGVGPPRTYKLRHAAARRHDPCRRCRGRYDSAR